MSLGENLLGESIGVELTFADKIDSRYIQSIGVELTFADKIDSRYIEAKAHSRYIQSIGVDLTFHRGRIPKERIHPFPPLQWRGYWVAIQLLGVNLQMYWA